ncbi:hypothetical protein C6A85_000000101010 [Mycobacterium sp. ITM-2017-0098]|nr:hypothetical protein C6A85_000000101010 [Mycobacterium sp. ITM-2017-0098]
MKYTAIAAGVAAGLSAVTVGLAWPANAGPAGPGSARHTIDQLERLGNLVIVKRLSDAPLTQASVVSVQPGAQIRESVWNAVDDGSQPAAGGQVVYVAVR